MENLSAADLKLKKGEDPLKMTEDLVKRYRIAKS